MRYRNREQLKRTSIKTVAFIGIIAILFAGFWAVGVQRVFAADNIIAVTTTVDEDADPGTGCSLYEAIIAANTNTAYGGCSAGSAVDHDVISLPAGTYARDAENGPTVENEDPRMLDLDDISLIGAGVGQTIIDGYGLNMVEDDEASIESLSMTTSASYSWATYLWVSGSNKTISGVELANGGMAVVDITFKPAAEQTISNILIENTDIVATPFATNPATNIQCNGGGICQDITFDNVNITSNFLTTVNLDTSNNVSFINSSVNVLDSSSSGLFLGSNATVENVTIGVGNPVLNVGANSSISSVVLTNSTCGNNEVTIQEGTTIDGLEQYNGGCSNNIRYSGGGHAGALSNITQVQSGPDGGASLNVPATSVTNYTVQGGGSAVFTNDYEGAIIDNITIEAGLYGSNFTSKAASVSNVTITSPGYVGMEHNYDGAIFENITMTYTGDDSSASPALTFNGDNVTIDGLQAIRENDAEGVTHGYIYFYGTNPSLSNVKLQHTQVSAYDPGTLLIENFSAVGPSHLPALSVNGDVSSAIIRNGYITEARDGIVAYGNTSGAELLVENVQFDNLNGITSTGDGAISANGIDEVTVRDVTVYRSIQDYGGPIHVVNGTDHKISNVTIVDSNGGIFVESQDSQAMNVAINNVTVVNNEDSADHERNEFAAGLFLYTDPDDGGAISASVSNSVLGGTSAYSPCVATDDFDTLSSVLGGLITLDISHSYSNVSSCIDAGFTELDDFGLATTLADNDGGGQVGYNGESGVLQTLALDEESALIGAGDTATCEGTDARGKTRDPAAGCDVGAFQFAFVTTPPSGGDDDDDNEGTPGNNSGDNNNGNSGNNNSNNNGGSPSGETNGTNSDTPVSSDDDTDDSNTPPDGSTGSPSGQETSNNEKNNADDTSTGDNPSATIFMTAGIILGVGFISYIVWYLFRRRGES